MIPGLTPLENRYLKRQECAWCGQRLDIDQCSALNGECSPASRLARRRQVLRFYRPRSKVHTEDEAAKK